MESIYLLEKKHQPTFLTLPIATTTSLECCKIYIVEMYTMSHIRYLYRFSRIAQLKRVKQV